MTSENPGAAFLEMEFPVEVWLTSEEMPLESLLGLEPGGILPLTKDPDGPVDLVVNGTPVASGELVVVDGKFGIRVTATSVQKLASLDTGNEQEAQS
jgi:flagellar motor switch protein FliN/FliY